VFGRKRCFSVGKGKDIFKRDSKNYLRDSFKERKKRGRTRAAVTQRKEMGHKKQGTIGGG